MKIHEACEKFFKEHEKDYQLLWVLPAKDVETDQWVLYVNSLDKSKVRHISYFGFEVKLFGEVQETKEDIVVEKPEDNIICMHVSKDVYGFLQALIGHVVPQKEYETQWNALVQGFHMDHFVEELAANPSTLDRILPKNPAKFLELSNKLGNKSLNMYKEWENESQNSKYNS